MEPTPKKPTVWQMIKQAIDHLHTASYSDIKEFINSRWDDVNPLTINAQIIALTVNHNSRIHYPENSKPRTTDLGSSYDLLFNIGRGRVAKYNPSINGVWEIYLTEENKLAVRPYVLINQELYTPADILWIKNVTNEENGQAYMDLSENPFVLHFPNKHKNNIPTPKIGELILIRQKINGIPAFTHIVTPVTTNIEEDNSRTNFKFGRLVKVIAKTHLDNYIPVSQTLWNHVNFAPISNGNACRIDNIGKVNNADELRFEIWLKFSPHFLSSEKSSASITEAIISEIEITNPELSVSEGRVYLISHYARERNREIVNRKKLNALKSNSLICEVCEFSFQTIYKANYIECHHIVPISESGQRKTNLDDLALVCSNCHRMLHTKFEGEYLSIEQLKNRIIKLANQL
ncbi:MAG: HNH endonuclease [Sphingobacteriales bacterium JAD_PAG50586_3]|nr:MAG: HNH endonuclease [Sphingobacteriales bacterium JAD_PAG50586_3]